MALFIQRGEISLLCLISEQEKKKEIPKLNEWHKIKLKIKSTMITNSNLLNSCLFFLSERLDFHMVDNLLIAVHDFPMQMFTLLSVDVILLPRYVKWVLISEVCPHHQEFNEANGEKLGWEIDEEAACCFEQILVATLIKTAVVQVLTSHPTNHPSKMNKTGRALL